MVDYEMVMHMKRICQQLFMTTKEGCYSLRCIFKMKNKDNSFVTEHPCKCYLAMIALQEQLENYAKRPK